MSRGVNVERKTVPLELEEAQSEAEEECVGERETRELAVALGEGVAVLPSAAPG